MTLPGVALRELRLPAWFRVAPIVALPLLVLASGAPLAAAAGEVDPPPRIVSLAPHLTELAFEAGIGERMVGAVAWSDYPPEAERLPRIGDAFRLDLERIVRLGATDALAWPGGTPDEAVRRIEGLGIEVHSIAVRSLDAIPLALQELGRLGKATARASEAAARFNARRQALVERFSDRGAPIEVFYQVSQTPLFTLGGRHVINDVLALCGAENAFGDLDTEAAAIDLEALLDRNPAAIIAGRSAGEPDVSDAWAVHRSLRAVQCNHVLEVNPDLLVRPTTRLLDGAASLCEWLQQQVRRAPDPRCRFGAP